MWKWLTVTCLTLVVMVIGLAIAYQQPALRGPIDCWWHDGHEVHNLQKPPTGTPIIAASRLTEPVRDSCDAAHDPAIWANPDAPHNSLILGTNKRRSLNVYSLSGGLIDRQDNIGAPHSVDLRRFQDQFIVTVSDPAAAEIERFVLNEDTGDLAPAGRALRIPTETQLRGLCLYQTADSLFAFTTDASGWIQQFDLTDTRRSGWQKPIRTLRVRGPLEACQVDDQTHRLFVSQTDMGIWQFDARLNASATGILIADISAHGPLVADIGGVAVYQPERGPGYLIVLSEGNNSYVVYDRLPPFAYRGSFQIASGDQLLYGADGLAVMATPLGDLFPEGMLVVQDGTVRNAAGRLQPQRFAYVSWQDIRVALSLDITADAMR